MTGKEIGKMIEKKMRNWPAPSISADSINPSGIVLLKKVLQIMTLNEETASGRISDQTVSFSPSKLALI
ncbi:hypothetical protein D3C81_1805830 [compost metagenome]